METITLNIPVGLNVAEAYKDSPIQIRQSIELAGGQLISNFVSPSLGGTANRMLYDQDFYEWTQTTAALIRGGQWAILDREALAEEIESLGKSEQRALRSDLTVLLEHLLKLAIAAESMPNDFRRAGRGWRTTVKTKRLQVGHILRDMPSLRRTLPQVMEDAYEVARVEAAEGLRIEEDDVFERCPWTPEQVLDAGFWPQGTGNG
jgi:Domain of unknown function DUF29